MENTTKRKNSLLRWIRRLVNTSFDNRLEAFVLSLMDIQGAKELLLDFSKGKLVWHEIHTIVDLVTFKSTVVDGHIPAAVKSANSTKKQAARSKYRQYFVGIDFDEPVHEVIRLGYVTAFHKLEGYRDQLIALVNERGQQLYGKNVDIEAYLKTVHHFNMNDLTKYPETIRRINWICNCTKHYRGYPRKKGPPASCSGFDPAKRIVVSKEDFERDMDFLMQFTSRLFSCAMLAVGCIRFADIFDHSDEESKSKLAPTVFFLASIVVVYLHSLADESEDDFAKKWETFAVHLPGYLKSHYASAKKIQSEEPKPSSFPSH